MINFILQGNNIMKKIYLSLFLTITTLTTSCCEKPRDRAYYNYTTKYPNIIFNPTSPAYPLVVVSQNSYSQPGYTNTHPGIVDNQQFYNQIVNTNWPVYNEIMNMTYQRDQPVAPNTVELTPVYPQINNFHTTPPIEKSVIPQLNTRPMKLIMEQMYNDAYRVIDYERTTETPDKKTEYKNLFFLINSMNNARNYGINEDDMGKFAYKSYNRDITSKYIPLLFSCLKRYTLTVKETKEDLTSFSNNFYDTKLINIFEIGDTKIANNEQIIPDTDQSDAALKPYPAYAHLLSKLKILTNASLPTVDELTSCLYISEQTLFNHYSNGDSVDLKNEFYNKAYKLLINNGNTLDLYNLLLIIKMTKKLGAIQKESDLGRAILTFDPTETIAGKIVNFFDTHYCTIDTKNRISLFCELIEKYNNAQPHKERPSGRQFFCYNEQKELDLALPDFFDSRLFDENIYALDEFGQFRNNVIKLMNSDNHSVQLCVDHVYHSKG